MKWNYILSLFFCAILGKLLNLSEYPFLPLVNRDNSSTHLRGLFCDYYMWWMTRVKYLVP